GFESEFERWHTEEHMPERLGIPGFLRGRRFMNWQQVPHVCFTLYELAHTEVFRSPGYLARLNTPTDWTNRVMPGMTNFLRGVCETVVSFGDGTAGAVASLRLHTDGGTSATADMALAGAALQAFQIDGVTALHLGRHIAQWANATTGETRIRPPPSTAGFDYVVLVEAIDQKTLSRAWVQLQQLLTGAGALAVEGAQYALGYQLSAPR
ncbi:MAG: hypothetical protein JWP29_1595, partial [Rhodoferax sp.]|nr:hypothetical protein [Rhodoferax sp.]